MSAAFSSSDLHHLRARAEGWLDLGDWRSANEELENVTPELRARPQVLALWWRVHSEAGHWELALAVRRCATSEPPT